MRINLIPVQTERLRGKWRMWLMTDGATRRAATETLRSPQPPASSCTGRSHPAGCSPAGTASTGRAWRTASGWDRSICLLNVQMFVCGIYITKMTQRTVRVFVCLQALTASRISNFFLAWRTLICREKRRTQLSHKAFTFTIYNYTHEQHRSRKTWTLECREQGQCQSLTLVMHSGACCKIHERQHWHPGALKSTQDSLLTWPQRLFKLLIIRLIIYWQCPINFYTERFWLGETWWGLFKIISHKCPGIRRGYHLQAVEITPSCGRYLSVSDIINQSQKLNTLPYENTFPAAFPGSEPLHCTSQPMQNLNDIYVLHLRGHLYIQHISLQLLTSSAFQHFQLRLKEGKTSESSETRHPADGEGGWNKEGTAITAVTLNQSLCACRG